jgi:hypothetical protein
MGSYLHIRAVHEQTSERLAHFAIWLEDIPFLEDPPFLHNDLYGHETTTKLKLDNRHSQQYVMLGGLYVLGGGARAVSLKCDPVVIPGLPGIVLFTLILLPTMVGNILTM